LSGPQRRERILLERPSCSGHCRPRSQLSIVAAVSLRWAPATKSGRKSAGAEGSSSDCRGGGRADISHKGSARMLLHSMPPAGARSSIYFGPSIPDKQGHFPTFERIKRRVSRGFRGRRRGARHRHARPDDGRRTYLHMMRALEEDIDSRRAPTRPIILVIIIINKFYINVSPIRLWDNIAF
jgi:hypothetical protein